MTALELAQLISQAIEDEVNVDTSPKGAADYCKLSCEDSSGNTFVIKVIQMNAEDEDDSTNDCLGTGDLEDNDD